MRHDRGRGGVISKNLLTQKITRATLLALYCMAKICSQCGRTALSGQSRSHSNIATKRRQNVNLQSRKIDGDRVKICTRCLRTAVKVSAKS